MSCTKIECNCYEEAGSLIANGEHFKDNNCNQCVCRNGVKRCETGNSCKKSCVFANLSISHGEKTRLDCLVFKCDDGEPVLVSTACSD